MTSWYSFMEYTVTYNSEILGRPYVAFLQYPEYFFPGTDYTFVNTQSPVVLTSSLFLTAAVKCWSHFLCEWSLFPVVV